MPAEPRSLSSAISSRPTIVLPAVLAIGAVGVFGAFGERSARAETPPARSTLALRITESFHAGCPQKPSTRERIEAHLGRVREAAPGEQAIELAFAVVRRGTMSEGTLTLSLAGVSVERNASSKSCADVVAALSMMAAIAIGEETERLSGEGPGAREPAGADASQASQASPSRAAEDTRARPSESAAMAPEPTPSSRARATDAPAAREQPPPRRGRVGRVALSFGTSVEVDGNRGAVLMPSWFGQVSLPMPLEPTLRIGLARTLGLEADSSRGEATLRWTMVTLAGCVNLIRTEQLRLGPCVNGELGRLEATKVDPLPASNLSYFWPSAGGSGRLAWSFSPGFSIEGTFGVRVPLIARELYFNPDREAAVYRTPALVPFVGAGIVVRLL